MPSITITIKNTDSTNLYDKANDIIRCYHNP